MTRTMMYLSGSQHEDRVRRDAIRRAAREGAEGVVSPPSPAEKQATRDSFKREIRKAVDALASSAGGYRKA